MHDATATATEQAKLYDFTEQEHIITLNVRTREKPLYVKHRLRKPRFDELEIRDKKQTAESVTKGDEEIIEGAGSGPDLELWDKLILGVQGYKIEGGNGAEWFEQFEAEEMKSGILRVRRFAAPIPAEHKLAAIRALHESEYEVLGVDDDADVFVIGGTENRVKQTIGAYEITHTLREMTEAERVAFERDSMRASFVRGKGKQVRTRIQPNLKAYVTLYDALFVRLEGAIGDKSAVDPIFKRGAINALLSERSAVLQD